MKKAPQLRGAVGISAGLSCSDLAQLVHGEHATSG